MKIVVNGQEKEISESQTLNALIEQFCKNTKHIIAEVNGNIVKQNSWNDQKLEVGDSVEIVNFVGGG